MSETIKTPSAEMADFFTRQRANEGIKLPLSTPDGKETTHWIRIRGVDSDVFKRADAAGRRKLLELQDKVEAAGKDEAKRAELENDFNEIQRSVIASLVIDWSFTMECTLENVLNFLREAPQIQAEIDRLSARRKLFFARSSPASTPSLEASSG